MLNSIRKEITVAIFTACDIIIKVMVTLTCLLFKTDISCESKLEKEDQATPRLVSISKEDPCHFYMGVSPGDVIC